MRLRHWNWTASLALLLCMLAGCGGTHTQPASSSDAGGDGAQDDGSEPPPTDGGSRDGSELEPDPPEGDAQIDDVDPQPTIIPRCFTRSSTARAPFEIDVVLDCGESSGATPGLRVATDGGRAVLATTVVDQAVLLEAGPQDAALELLPEELARRTVELATNAAGEHKLLVDTSAYHGVDTELIGALTFLQKDGGAWRSEVVFDREGGWVPTHGFEIDSTGTANAWFFEDIAMIARATRGADGVWSYEHGLEQHSVAWQMHTLDPSDQPIAVWMEASGERSQLAATSGETSWQVGAPARANYARLMARATPSASEDAPPFAALLVQDAGFTVAWPDGEGGSVELAVPNTQDVPPTCSAYLNSGGCSAPCEERYDTVEIGTAAFAQTSDGSGWVIWLETHYDRAFEYETSCSPPSGPWPDPNSPPQEICSCASKLERDETTADLHIARVDFGGAMLREVMSMPIDAIRYGSGDDQFQDVRFIDARAFGEHLAIGLRLRGAGDPVDAWSSVYRLLQLDTAEL